MKNGKPKNGTKFPVETLDNIIRCLEESASEDKEEYIRFLEGLKEIVYHECACGKKVAPDEEYVVTPFEDVQCMDCYLEGME